MTHAVQRAHPSYPRLFVFAMVIAMFLLFAGGSWAAAKYQRNAYGKGRPWGYGYSGYGYGYGYGYGSKCFGYGYGYGYGYGFGYGKWGRIINMCTRQVKAPWLHNRAGNGQKGEMPSVWNVRLSR